MNKQGDTSMLTDIGSSCTEKNWVDYIPLLNQTFNKLYHDTTGFTPNELHFGTKTQRFWDKQIHRDLNIDLRLDIKYNVFEKRKRGGKELKIFNEITSFQNSKLETSSLLNNAITQMNSNPPLLNISKCMDFIHT